MMLVVFTSSVMMTNSTVIRSGNEGILVDPAWTTAELGRLAQHVSGLTIVCGWATHAHHDHVLWHPGFGDGPRYATPGAARDAMEHQGKLQQAASAHLSWDLVPLVGWVEVFDGRKLPWNGPEVQIITHHGHARGHGALWLPEEKVLIAGDMLSDVEIPLVAETGWQAYKDGLTALESYVREAVDVIPGHGRRTSAVSGDSPLARWEADMTYLKSAAVGRGHTDSRLSTGPAWLSDAHNENLQSLT